MTVAALGAHPARGEDRLFLHAPPMKRGSFARNLWYYRELPTLAAELAADIVHFAYPMPVNKNAFACSTVVTLHDLYPYEIPSNFGFPKVLFNRSVLRQCLRDIDAIACVSDVTCLRLARYLPRVPWHKSIRIYNCVEHDNSATIEPVLPEPCAQPFLLCVAQHRRNKNVPLLIKTFDKLLRSGELASETRLVLVGIPGPETQQIRNLVTKHTLEKRVLLLSGLSETALQWCYRNCEALLAPSSTEGFGLPVAEAMLAGARVICSDIPAFQELDLAGKGRCKFFSLETNPEHEFAAAILAALREAPAAPVDLPEFSTPILAAQYKAFYAEILDISASVTGPYSQIACSLLPRSSERPSV